LALGFENAALQVSLFSYWQQQEGDHYAFLAEWRKDELQKNLLMHTRMLQGLCMDEVWCGQSFKVREA
jgi:hypothetical protein